MKIQISREDLNIAVNALYMQTTDILVRSNRTKSAKKKAELLAWFERNRQVRDNLQKQLEAADAINARIKALEIQCDGIGEDDCAELVALRSMINA